MNREMKKDFDTSAPASWETEADVVVVGYGAARAAAAIAAHDASAKVLMLEEAPQRFRVPAAGFPETAPSFPLM